MKRIDRRTDLVVDILFNAGEEREEKRQLDVLVAVDGGGEGPVDLWVVCDCD